jgi:hypothetical protein
MIKMTRHIQSIGLLVLTTLLVFLTGKLQAQENTDHNEQVTIIGSFDPSINEAYKINQRPQEQQINLSHPDFNYNYLDRQATTKITLQPITPASINVDKRTKYYKNLLIAGVGSLFSPYLNFLHSNGARNSYRFTTQIYHLSAFRNIPEYNNPYTNTSALVKYEKFAGKHIVTTGLKYQLKTNRFYGYSDQEYNIPDSDSLKQMFNLIKGSIGIKSNYRNNKKLIHTINLSGYYYFDKYKTSEANANLSLNLYKSFDVTKTLNYQFLGVQGDFDYFNYKHTVSTNEFMFSLVPYFKARFGIINFKLGLNFSYLQADGGSLHFYPDIDATVDLIPEILTVYAGINGGLEKNSFYHLSDENPYVISDIQTKWKDNKFTAYAGIRGNIGQKVGYNFEGGWSKFNDEYFFVNTFYNPSQPVESPINKFEALYDNGSVWHISAELNYTYDTKFKTWLKFRYNGYSLDSLPEPYHKPITEVRFGASYLIKTVNVWTEIYYSGKRYAYDPKWIINNTDLTSLGYVQTLDAIIDINMGVDYQIKDNLSIFLKVTNLLNYNYDLYYQYPSQGINIMAGIRYKF